MEVRGYGYLLPAVGSPIEGMAEIVVVWLRGRQKGNVTAASTHIIVGKVNLGLRDTLLSDRPDQ